MPVCMVLFLEDGRVTGFGDDVGNLPGDAANGYADDAIIEHSDNVAVEPPDDSLVGHSGVAIYLATWLSIPGDLCSVFLQLFSFRRPKSISHKGRDGHGADASRNGSDIAAFGRHALKCNISPDGISSFL